METSQRDRRRKETEEGNGLEEVQKQIEVTAKEVNFSAKAMRVNAERCWGTLIHPYVSSTPQVHKTATPPTQRDAHTHELAL